MEKIGDSRSSASAAGADSVLTTHPIVSSLNVFKHVPNSTRIHALLDQSRIWSKLIMGLPFSVSFALLPDDLLSNNFTCASFSRGWPEQYCRPFFLQFSGYAIDVFFHCQPYALTAFVPAVRVPETRLAYHDCSIIYWNTWNWCDFAANSECHGWNNFLLISVPSFRSQHCVSRFSEMEEDATIITSYHLSSTLLLGHLNLRNTSQAVRIRRLIKKCFSAYLCNLEQGTYHIIDSSTCYIYTRTVIVAQ